MRGQTRPCSGGGCRLGKPGMQRHLSLSGGQSWPGGTAGMAAVDTVGARGRSHGTAPPTCAFHGREAYSYFVTNSVVPFVRAFPMSLPFQLQLPIITSCHPGCPYMTMDTTPTHHRTPMTQPHAASGSPTSLLLPAISWLCFWSASIYSKCRVRNRRTSSVQFCGVLSSAYTQG